MDETIDIKRFLPHRKPMLMVDIINHMTDQEIITTLTIREDNLFLENGYLSESGIIENAAQTSSSIIGRPFFEEHKTDPSYKINGYISKIKSIKIFRLPSLNQELKTHGKLIVSQQVNDFFNCEMSCDTFCDDEIIAQSHFNLIIRPGAEL